MRTIATSFATICLLACVVLTASAQGRDAWVQDWREARELAQSQQRLVLLHFYSQTCPPCQRLERNVFPRPEVGRALGSGYVAVKIDVDQHPELVKFYRVQQWPTDVIVDPRGKEVYRSSPTPQDPNRFISMLDEVRAHYYAGRQASPELRQQNQVAARPQTAADRGNFADPAARESVAAERMPASSVPEPTSNGRSTAPTMDSVATNDPRVEQPVPGGRANVLSAGSGGDFPAQGYNDQAGAGQYAFSASEATQHATGSAGAIDRRDPTVLPGPPSANPSIASPGLPNAGTASAVQSSGRSQPGAGAGDRWSNASLDVAGNSANAAAGGGQVVPGSVVTNQYASGPEVPQASGAYDPRSAFPAQQPNWDTRGGSAQAATPAQTVSNARPGVSFDNSAAVNTPAGAANFSPASMPSSGGQPSLGGAPVGANPGTTNFATNPGPPTDAPLPPNCAMEGYCAVTLVLMNEWARGDRQWGAEHEGRIYLFTSREFRDQFLADPYRFAPVLGGFDPVRFMETGQFVDGKRKHGVFYANTIYLFHDEVALNRFSKQPDFYVAQLRQAMASQRGTMR